MRGRIVGVCAAVAAGVGVAAFLGGAVLQHQRTETSKASLARSASPSP